MYQYLFEVERVRRSPARVLLPEQNVEMGQTRLSLAQ